MATLSRRQDRVAGRRPARQQRRRTLCRAAGILPGPCRELDLEGADRAEGRGAGRHHAMSAPAAGNDWPELPYAAWRDSCETLQLWTQIVGKIRLAQTPWLNHSWHVALYVTPRGLTTSPIPDGARTFQIDFDFIDHVLRIATSDGAQQQIAADGAIGRELLRRGDGGARRARHRRHHRRHAERIAGADPLFARRAACLLRPGRGAALPAGAGERRPRVQAIPHRLPRQGEPGAFLLGQF